MKARIYGAAALAAALALSACGGKASFEVSGTLIDGNNVQKGVANPGLVLQLNGGNNLEVAVGAEKFSFPNHISYGDDYAVTVLQSPQHMTCAAINGTGSAGHTATISVTVKCTQNVYSLGGTVNNLTLDGLQIINGSSSNVSTIGKGAPSFTFVDAIAVGTPYGLTVSNQPKDATTGATQVCTISNGTGIMGDANRVNVVIDCK
jgi:hypothetical protein